MLMPALLRGPSRLLAPLSAAVALTLAAAPAAADEAKRTLALVVAKPDEKPDTKPDAPDAPTLAVSAPDTKENPAWDSARAVHRSGFVVGLALGSGVVAFSGFPNDSRKVGLERYYTETGASVGGMFSLWIGGALSDWFTFGVGFTGGSMPLLSDQEASSGGLIFHVDAYPLFPLGGRWRDVGVMFDAGTGSATVMPKDSESKLIDGGGASLVGLGPFYEGFKLWKTKGGPYVEGSYMWSDTVRRPAVFFGWRTSLYTGI
jgi:hypothetical protein